MAARTGRRSTRARGAALEFRRRPCARDIPALARLVAATGVFNPTELAVAREILEERLAHGRSSGYSFVLAERDGTLVGYTAWGPIPLTRGSYDLYWIAVDPSAQGLGVGRALLAETERDVARHGGGRIYIETSGRPAYERTRRFYLAAGYAEVARLEDFYAVGDDKVIYRKVVPAAPRRGKRGGRAPAR